jgi:hypothetical protein
MQQAAVKKGNVRALQFLNSSMDIRGSFEITRDGTLKTDLFEIRKMGYTKTPHLENQLRGRAASEGNLKQLETICSANLVHLGSIGRGASGVVMRYVFFAHAPLLNPTTRQSKK